MKLAPWDFCGRLAGPTGAEVFGVVVVVIGGERCQHDSQTNRTDRILGGWGITLFCGLGLLGG